MRSHYATELDAVRRNLIAMGETTGDLFSEALRAVADPCAANTARASELEARTDHQHRLIHDQCFNLITLQSPVARDARLLTGALDAIVDLELIGDYAYEIVGLSTAKQVRLPSQIVNQISDIGGRIGEILGAAVGCWRSEDRGSALDARPRESAVRADCHALADKVSRLTAAPGDVTHYVNVLLICRHLERILRHAVCVAEQAAEAARPAAAV